MKPTQAESRAFISENRPPELESSCISANTCGDSVRRVRPMPTGLFAELIIGEYKRRVDPATCQLHLATRFGRQVTLTHLGTEKFGEQCQRNIKQRCATLSKFQDFKSMEAGGGGCVCVHRHKMF